MRILFVTIHSSIQGRANLDVFNAGAEMVRRGHEVSVIARDDGESASLPTVLNGIDLYPIAFRSAMESFVRLPEFFARSLRVASRIKPDVLIVENNLHCPFVGVSISKKLGVPCMILLRELTAESLFHDRHRRVLKRMLARLMMLAGHRLLRNAKSLFAINQGIAEYYEPILKREVPYTWLMCFPDRRQAKNQGLIEKVARRFGIIKEQVTVLYAGTLTQDRNLDDFISAWSHVSNPEAIRLIVTGHGSYVQQILESAVETLTEEYMTYAGWLPNEELHALVGLVDFGLEPYRRPWPQNHTPSTKLALYASHGTFVLARDAPGYRGLLEQGVGAYFYDDAQELARFLQECLDYPDVLADIRRREWADEAARAVDVVPAVDRLLYAVHALVDEKRAG